MPAEYHLDATAEKAQYDLHDNRPDDPAYRRFLTRAADAVTARLAPPARGLDFGCGPGPTLSIMLAEAGYDMTVFDPFYAADSGVFATDYDFITATEVFEHLRDPKGELERLLSCLRPGGWLIVMTRRPHGDRESFAAWHYIHDPTHVCFYSLETFDWIARHFGLIAETVADDVVALATGRSPRSSERATARI